MAEREEYRRGERKEGKEGERGGREREERRGGGLKMTAYWPLSMPNSIRDPST